MAEPLTIYECPDHGVISAPVETVPPCCPEHRCGRVPREVRLFREEDVRSLYEGFRHIVSEWRYLIDEDDESMTHPALDAFPAPDSWKSGIP